MIRKLTAAELEEMRLERVRIGAVGQNAEVCKCGEIKLFPNNEMFKNVIFYVPCCHKCDEMGAKCR